MMKRLFDVIVACLGLVMLSPLLGVVALIIKLDSRGPALFCQERIGRRFRPFLIYKFRTMVQDAPTDRGNITMSEDDPRITRVGRVLRSTKIDELPQLINVLNGEMSVVGPRPEIRQYVEMFRQDYEEILRVRPGMTDLASIKFSNEAALLGQFPNPGEAYVHRVLVEKIDLAKEYIRGHSLRLDLTILLKTLVRVLGWEVGV
jgi:lipopolysaccharide/colanic/teichoic acid biosynthesis glycosyltransferase